MIRSIFTAVMMTVVLAGCNTFAGMGRDIERSGEVVQREANEARPSGR